MKPFLLIILTFLASITSAQVNSLSALSRLKTGAPLPEKILSSRSAVLYSPELTRKEIDEIHASLARTGIDAVAYFELDRVFAGRDVQLAFSEYFSTREISNFVVFQKSSTYKIIVTPYNGGTNLIEPEQSAWMTEDAYLKEALRLLYSNALNAYRKQNLLISEVAETRLSVNVITGRRTEAFATDLKVDRLAVQKFGDEQLDRELEEIMKDYPFKYTLVDNMIPETELRKQGMFYILCMIQSRGPVAKQLLGYEVGEAESALVSVTFPNGQEQLKTIPANTQVYKFYARQIQFNNVFLGTRWDADVNWQQALRNFILGFKRELRIN
ncbi:MAG: hypothetical protein KF687_01815 [Cyclobacteriaceae bacterium]|nr:hypothetical protein [Cyclobacteriaceae bacterium]